MRNENENRGQIAQQLFRVKGWFSDHDPSVVVTPTNFCNFSCVFCYSDSGPHVKTPNARRDLVLDFIRECQGIESIIASGGEVSLLDYFNEMTYAASQSARSVEVYTNATGFIKSRSALRRESNPTHVIRDQLKKNLEAFPPNVTFVLPITEYHLSNPHLAHRHHRSAIKAAVLLAQEWNQDNLRPNIKFNVRNTVGVKGSGQQLINSFGIFPEMIRTHGDVFGEGRAVTKLGLKPPLPHETDNFLGGAFNDTVRVIYV